MQVDCSIVILAHNGAHFTRYCLRSLGRASTLPRQLLLVDNASADDTPAVIAAEIPELRRAGIEVATWRNAENLGCSLARNQAWEQAAGEYVVFLDNDAAVRSRDWLAGLAGALQADPRLAIVGPKLVYPFLPHPIQCAGVAINPLGRIRFRGRGRPLQDPAYAQPARVPALISACWMMRNRLLREIGGLDELFHPVQYEDLDLCLRANQAGYHCAYLPTVEMYHFEGRTTAAEGKPAYQRNIAEQSAKFRRKWRDTLKNYPPDPEDYRWLADAELGLGQELDLSLA